MSVLSLNKMALDLAAKDFSDGHNPTNGGPTKTARALAIFHLAARDAYAMVTSAYKAKLGGLPPVPAGFGTTPAIGESAAIGAGIRAALLLYPDFSAFINDQSKAPVFLTARENSAAMSYGAVVAEHWMASRQGDGSSLPQTDTMYSSAPGHHRADPVSGKATLGRTWGFVKPFVIASVEADAPLMPPPALTDIEYAKAYDEVFDMGRDNITQRDDAYRQKAAIGLFWAYDGANKIGVPPRLYNQAVLKAAGFPTNAKDQLNILAAINAAMADAGIAAWYWKYVYDFWRPVVGIREADAGWGPLGLGDGNTLRKEKGDPFWLPLGAPASNPAPGPLPVTVAMGDNFTPNFPAYPSGHATFGTACFETFAKLIGKAPKDISVVKFMSDELNGVTTDNQGIVRPAWCQTFTLQEAIQQNLDSRIYLGVHWCFDATGGQKLGSAIAVKAAAAFA